MQDNRRSVSRHVPSAPTPGDEGADDRTRPAPVTAPSSTGQLPFGVRTRPGVTLTCADAPPPAGVQAANGESDTVGSPRYRLAIPQGWAVSVDSGPLLAARAAAERGDNAAELTHLLAAYTMNSTATVPEREAIIRLANNGRLLVLTVERHRALRRGAVDITRRIGPPPLAAHAGFEDLLCAMLALAMRETRDAIVQHNHRARAVTFATDWLGLSATSTAAHSMQEAVVEVLLEDDAVLGVQEGALADIDALGRRLRARLRAAHKRWKMVGETTIRHRPIRSLNERRVLKGGAMVEIGDVLPAPHAVEDEALAGDDLRLRPIRQWMTQVSPTEQQILFDVVVGGCGWGEAARRVGLEAAAGDALRRRWNRLVARVRARAGAETVQTP